MLGFLVIVHETGYYPVCSQDAVYHGLFGDGGVVAVGRVCRPLILDGFWLHSVVLVFVKGRGVGGTQRMVEPCEHKVDDDGLGETDEKPS